MDFTSNLKNKISKAESKEEIKNIMSDVGLILNDEELDLIAGGGGNDLACGIYAKGRRDLNDGIILNDGFLLNGKPQSGATSKKAF
ncbi:MAG: hypothetical protein E7301_08750 [Butyrivibrio sp.]|nr:hypothetical protein [Butyrivibrio sp.]